MGPIRAPSLVAVCILGTLGTIGAQQPTFRDVAQVVRVFVTVTDRDGRLVTTLEQKDFEIRDEGRPQPITLFDNRPRAMRLIVMLDTSSSMEFNVPLLRAATEQLFMHLGPDDQVRLGSFGHGGISISPTFTNDVEELHAALPTAKTMGGGTPLWKGLQAAVSGFPSESPERRVILVMSDGKDTAAMRGRLVPDEAETIDLARRADVMVYAVGLRSRGTLPFYSSGSYGVTCPGGCTDRAIVPTGQEPDWPDAALRRVAKDTGGGYAEIGFGRDLGPVFAQIADELHSQFLLGFAPPKRDGKTHKIQVRVPRGLTPRARTVYIAPK
jgi:VWFA-related protein